MYQPYKQQLCTQTYFTPAIFLVDSYKLSHRDMYPENMECLFSTWTPRSPKIAIQAQRQLPLQASEVVFFGISMAIQKLLREFHAWFQRDEDEVVAEYETFIEEFHGVRPDNVQHVRDLHQYGVEHDGLPLRLFALREGTVTKTGVCQLVVFNIGGDKFSWVTNYVESILSTLMWKPATSATIARNYYLLALHFAQITCDEEGGEFPHIKYQQHDFAFRGLSGVEDAESSAIGHLLFFGGTDTVPALFAVKGLYADFRIRGEYGSVPASEHSVACSTMATISYQLAEYGTYAGRTITEWLESFDAVPNLPPLDGKQLAELISIADTLEKYPEGILSWVSDTWDFWYVLTNLLPRLKSRIMARNGKLVIRPDSGDPVKIINGDQDAPFGTPEYWGAINLLGQIFGSITNRKGFRVLDPHIGLIYGDSITLDRAEAIYTGLARNGWAASNVVLGIGSYTYQATTRDVWGFAMKATAIIVNGVEIPIYKDPKTDDGVKKSFKGFCTTRVINGEYVTVDGLTFEEATDLTNSAFIEYPMHFGGIVANGLNHWPTIMATAKEHTVNSVILRAAAG